MLRNTGGKKKLHDKYETSQQAQILTGFTPSIPSRETKFRRFNFPWNPALFTLVQINCFKKETPCEYSQTFTYAFKKLNEG